MAPESAAQEHLDILAEVAERMSDENLRKRLAVEMDPEIVYRLLTTGAA
jgi:PTS system nitrogen regulatory IIA component